MNETKIQKNCECTNFICRIVFVSLTVVALMTVIGFLALGWFQNPSSVESIGDARIYHNFAGVGAREARIAIILLLAVILLWFPRHISKKIKLIPFIWIVVEYVFWGISSYQIYSSSENTSAYEGVLFLFNANWWDIMILLVVLTCSVCILIETKRKYE